MKLVKPLSLGLLHKAYRYRGRHRLAVTALGFFRLGAPAERFLPEHLQWPLVAPLLPKEQPFDELIPKAHGEVLLAGAAHAPCGAEAREMQVRVQLGAVDKTLRVLGEREWLYGLYPLYRITEPAPFREMPLGYERAYGGAAFAANPVGRGHTGNRFAAVFGANRGPMPNLEYPGEPVRSNCARYRPAGFGPLDRRWSPRKDKRGTYDERWLSEDFPGFAADTDWSVFNAAPQDQHLEGLFAGGERYRLEGLHPDEPVVEGELPRLRARAFAMRKGAAPLDAEEIALACDTVWLFPDRKLGLALHRGETFIEDSDALDVEALMAGYERAADAPRPLAHYREVLGLRLAPQTAALHAFNEQQLTPQKTAAERAQQDERRARAVAADLAKRQGMLDELAAELWQTSGLTPPAGHAPPKAEPAPLGVVSAEMIEAGDFDLAEFVAKGQALAEDAKRRGEAQLGALPTPPAPDPEALDAALARIAAVPGELIRKARRAAPEATTRPVAAPAAAAIGAQVRAWREAGVALAGRDLAGGSLRGADFSGADLRETLFERADLTGARFVNANLTGAVFTGATLDDADFSGANLAEANLSRSRGERIRLGGANLAKAQAIEAAWPRAELARAVLDGLIAMKIDLAEAVLDEVSLADAVLMQASAPRSRWRGAKLQKTLLYGAALAGADFAGASVVQSVFLDADLGGSRWRGARLFKVAAGGKADWSGAVLDGARAEQSSWRGATMTGASLHLAKFLQCDLGDADLSGGDLRGALLVRSILFGTRFAGCRAEAADLFQAIARKADFRRADLRGANLVQAELSDARFEEAVRA